MTRKNIGTILIETGDRFARDLMVQELGLQQLSELNITVIPVDNPTHFSDPSSVAKLIRHMLRASYAFVANQIRDHMQHGYCKAKAHIAADPHGRLL